ncbi:MAG TPA: hypothetical protein VGK73_30645 [Polyangiaceae bacterium]
MTKRSNSTVGAIYSRLSTGRQGLEKEYARVVKRLAQADGLWRYWKSNDISENDDLWAEFSNAVYAHLEGKPVPKKFIKP